MTVVSWAAKGFGGSSSAPIGREVLNRTGVEDQYEIQGSFFSGKAGSLARRMFCNASFDAGSRHWKPNLDRVESERPTWGDSKPPNQCRTAHKELRQKYPEIASQTV